MTMQYGFPLAPERPCTDCGALTSYRIHKQDADYAVYAIPKCPPNSPCDRDYQAWLKDHEAAVRCQAGLDRFSEALARIELYLDADRAAAK